MLIRRILMTALDASPGSGSAPSNPPAPGATTTEQASAPAPQSAPASGSQIDIAAITRQITEQVTKSVQDGVFATLRRAGVLPNRSNPAPTAPSSAPSVTTPGAGGDVPTTTATPAPSVNTMALRALDRALNRAGCSASLSDRAYQRLERAFLEDQPDDVDAWVTDYFEGLGIKRGATAPTTATPTTVMATTTPPPTTQPAAPAAPAPTTAPPTPPASDRGAPPPTSIPLEERKLQDMSEADRAEYIRRHGMKKYAEKLARDLAGTRVR